MPLVFTEREVETTRGVRRALLATPSSPLIYTRLRAKQMRLAAGLSEVDEEILSALDAQATPVDLFVFRGGDDETGSWRFADDFDETTAAVAATDLFQAHLQLYRQMLKRGVILTAYSDWPERELMAFRAGADALAARITRRLDGSRDTEEQVLHLLELDQWILRNFVTFVHSDLESALGQALPAKLGMVLGRVDRARSLLRGLSTEALDQLALA
jgi:hypothetical protein